MKTPAMIITATVALALTGAAPALARHHQGARAQAGPGDTWHAYRDHGPYPWCAHYNNMTGECGFVAFEQCLETARGNGGYCTPNPGYNAHP